MEQDSLKTCYQDYGPCYGYWLFGFERYNGMIGKYNTNQLSIEIQLMRRFVNDMSIKSIVHRDIYLNTEQQELYETLLGSSSGGTSTGTLYEQGFEVSGNLMTRMSSSEIDISPSLDYLENEGAKVLPPFTLYSFDLDVLAYL